MTPGLVEVSGAGDALSLALLAVVQGLTEFLPVSSSGHLVLAHAALGWETPPLAIDVALHVGTLVAVVLVYRRDLLGITADLFAGRPREVLLLVLGSLPAAVVGLGLRDVFGEAFLNPGAAAIGLAVTSAVLLVGEWCRRRNAARVSATGAAPAGGRAVGWADALVIGCAQAVAIWPGISRSGSTIAAGLVRGLDPSAAARFSFLLSIPAILGAAVLELPKAGDSGVGGWMLVAAGALAALVGWIALRILLATLQRGAFMGFAVYCAVLAILVRIYW